MQRIIIILVLVYSWWVFIVEKNISLQVNCGNGGSVIEEAGNPARGYE